MTANRSALDFDLPPELDVHEPPEARGRARDDVRLMVAWRHDGRLAHARFRDLAHFLRPGDLLVINTSGTLPAALSATRPDGAELELHLSTPMPSGSGRIDLEDPGAAGPWIVEFRRVREGRSLPFRAPASGERLALPGAGSADVLGPYPPDCGPDSTEPGESRLWVTALALPEALGPYLRRHGRPIQYSNLDAEWPSSY